MRKLLRTTLKERKHKNWKKLETTEKSRKWQACSLFTANSCGWETATTLQNPPNSPTFPSVFLVGSFLIFYVENTKQYIIYHDKTTLLFPFKQKKKLNKKKKQNLRGWDLKNVRACNRWIDYYKLIILILANTNNYILFIDYHLTSISIWHFFDAVDIPWKWRKNQIKI